MRYLVTGAAGFIGAAVTGALTKSGHEVVGVDNINDYYDQKLKRDRLKLLREYVKFRFEEFDICDEKKIGDIFVDHKFDCVIHLAAQAGVRYSLTNPRAYIDANVCGFLNILEGCRSAEIRHLVFASSSSVYGLNEKMPFAVSDNVDHPISLYAATKKSNELMAHCYAHLYRIPVTGLRFFTAYGPWGRPDMAIFLFTRKILNDEPIDVFNNGHHARDFTYIDDIVDGIIKISQAPPTPSPDWSGQAPNPAYSCAPYRLFNIGNNKPVALMDFIAAVEKATGKSAIKNFLPKQPGDVVETYADISNLKQVTGFSPRTPLIEGISKFVDWYRAYYK